VAICSSGLDLAGNSDGGLNAARRSDPLRLRTARCFGERWLGYLKRLAELKHCKLALLQPLKNASARGVGHRSKYPIVQIMPHGAA